MFPFGLYLTGALVVLVLFGVLDPRKLGISRAFAAIAAAVLFVGYFFPPVVIGAWEINVAGITVPVVFGAALLIRSKMSGAAVAFFSAVLGVWSATRVETYSYWVLLGVAAAVAAALGIIVYFTSGASTLRGGIAGLCLGAAVGEILRCWTEIRKDGVLITECGMGRYFDIVLLALVAAAVVVPLVKSRLKSTGKATS